MKKKKFLILVLFIAALLISVFAIKMYLDKIKPINVSQNKQFAIDLGHKIILDDTTKQNISIKDKDGHSIEAYLFLSADNKSIFINPPIGGYAPDDTYSLTISPGVHLQDYSLKKKIEINFTAVKNSIQPPVKEKRKPQYGDIIGTSTQFMGYKYEHYGIYVGNNKVIHYVSNTGKIEDNEIRETDMKPYFNEGDYFILNFKDSRKFSPDETVKRAKERLGEKSYDLLQNNCEHFAIWCETDNAESYQIDRLSKDQVAQLEQLLSFGLGLQ